MKDTILGTILLTLLVIITINMFYGLFYNYRINAAFKSGKKTSLPIRLKFLAVSSSILLTMCLVFISYYSFFIYNKGTDLPYSTTGYSIYSYADIKPNNKVYLFKEYIDSETNIPGFVIQDSKTVGDFQYIIYSSIENDNRIEFIIYIKYLETVEIDYKSTVLVELKVNGIFKGNPKTFMGSKDYIIYGDSIESFNLKLSITIEGFNSSNSVYYEIDKLNDELTITK